MMAAVALSWAVARMVRNLHREAAEREFAAWYRAAEDQVLVLENGYWKTVPIERVEQIKAVECERSIPGVIPSDLSYQR
jgi:hypothetical protein